jgi:hypothetical protein
MAWTCGKRASAQHDFLDRDLFRAAIQALDTSHPNAFGTIKTPRPQRFSDFTGLRSMVRQK